MDCAPCAEGTESTGTCLERWKQRPSGGCPNRRGSRRCRATNPGIVSTHVLTAALARLSLISARQFQKRQPIPRGGLSLIRFPCVVVVNDRLSPTIEDASASGTLTVHHLTTSHSVQSVRALDIELFTGPKAASERRWRSPPSTECPFSDLAGPPHPKRRT